MVLSSRLRRTAALVAVICGAVLASACLPNPIHPDNRPTTIPNAMNGHIGDDSLRAAGPTCLVWREAAASLGTMIADARRAGIQLSTLECYRNYADQVEIRKDWCFVGMCHMAAVPGTSNHGWAKAADFADQGGELTFDSPGYHWLKANASRYGWNHPRAMWPGGSSPEAWHWDWVGDGGQMFPGQTYGVGNAASLPPDGTPVGSLDIAQGTATGPGVRIAGWVIDPNTTAPVALHVYLDGTGVPAPTASRPRADIGSIYTAWGTNHGFDATILAPPGPHRICVWAINHTGRGDNITLGCRDVAVPTP